MCMYHLIPIASPDKAFCNNFMILKSTCFAVRLYWYWLSIFPISVMAESWCRLNQVVVPVTPRPIRLQTGGGGMEGIPMFTGQRDFLQDISIKSIYEWKIKVMNYISSVGPIDNTVWGKCLLKSCVFPMWSCFCSDVLYTVSTVILQWSCRETKCK